MKKFISMFLFIICIISYFTPISFADIETPWTNKEIRIQLIERFRKLDGKLEINDDNYEFTRFTYLKETYGKYEWKNGAFVHYDGDASGDWFAYNSPLIAELGLEPFSNAQGLGCYVENNSESFDLKLGFTLKQSEENFYIISSSMGKIYYASADGKETGCLETDESWGQSIAIIKPGFKGYVLVPFSSLKNKSTGNAWDTKSSFLTQIGFIFMQSIANERTGENTLIDNIFLYGKDVVDNNDGIITGALAYPAPETFASSPLETYIGDIFGLSLSSVRILYAIFSVLIIIGICIIIYLLIKKYFKRKL